MDQLGARNVTLVPAKEECSQQSARGWCQEVYPERIEHSTEEGWTDRTRRVEARIGQWCFDDDDG